MVTHLSVTNQRTRPQVTSTNFYWVTFRQEILDNFQNPISVLALQEIWSVPPGLQVAGYQPIIYNSRDKDQPTRDSNCGGGAAVFLRNGLDSEILTFKDQFVRGVYESVWVKIQLSKNKGVIVASIYRPNTKPLESLAKATQIHHDILLQIKRDPALKGCKVYLCGDFNVNLLNFESHKATGEFLDMSLEKGFIPYITKPTRVTAHSATLIDNIYTNSNTVANARLLMCDISDHFPCVIFDTIGVFITPASNRIRDTSDSAIRNLKNALGFSDWDCVLNSSDAEKASDDFFKLIGVAVETYLPYKTVKTKPTRRLAPWFTSGLKVSSSTKQKLLRDKLKNPSMENCEKYKLYKNLYNSLCRKAEKLYLSEQFLAKSKNIKATWRLINSTLGRASKKGGKLAEFFRDKNGTKITTADSIAEGFNNYFATIGQNLADKIPATDKNIFDYLPPRILTKLHFCTRSEAKILAIVGKLKPKLSAGTDGLAPKFLRK